MRILLAFVILMISTSVFAQRSRVRENVKQQGFTSTESGLNTKVSIEGVEEVADTDSNQKKRNIRKKSK